MNQSELTQWTAGMFDGDGSIQAKVALSKSTNTGYRLDAKCTLTNSYVAGLFDAEGVVSPVISKKNNSSVNHHIDSRCRITQHENDPLIEKLRAFCDELNVESHVYHQTYPDKENRSPTFQFDITGNHNVRQFLSQIQPYLVVKNQQSEIMTSEIIPRLMASEHSTRRGFLKVMHHIDQLNALKGGNRGKYNLEYFEDLWGMKHDPTMYD